METARMANEAAAKILLNSFFMSYLLLCFPAFIFFRIRKAGLVRVRIVCARGLKSTERLFGNFTKEISR
jgi:hypothetical protein